MTVGEQWRSTKNKKKLKSFNFALTSSQCFSAIRFLYYCFFVCLLSQIGPAMPKSILFSPGIKIPSPSRTVQRYQSRAVAKKEGSKIKSNHLGPATRSWLTQRKFTHNHGNCIVMYRKTIDLMCRPKGRPGLFWRGKAIRTEHRRTQRIAFRRLGWCFIYLFSLFS